MISMPTSSFIGRIVLVWQIPSILIGIPPRHVVGKKVEEEDEEEVSSSFLLFLSLFVVVITDNLETTLKVISEAAAKACGLGVGTVLASGASTPIQQPLNCHTKFSFLANVPLHMKRLSRLRLVDPIIFLSEAFFVVKIPVDATVVASLQFRRLHHLINKTEGEGRERTTVVYKTYYAFLMIMNDR